MGERIVEVDVLGPIRARVDGADLTPDGPLQRRLLALLVLHRGTTVTTGACIDALWPSDPPRDPAAALQTHLYRLRRSLPGGVVESTAAGYRVDRALIDLDADRLAAAVHSADRVAIAATLDGWHGPAYPELLEHDGGHAESARLDELRVAAVEVLARARLDDGDTDGLVAEVAALAAAHPLREGPVELLMDALAATGRTAEALRAYDDFRRRLADELGIDPSAALSAKHGALLRGQDAPMPSPEPSPSPSPSTTHDPWSPPDRLPAAVSSLIGRDELVADALALVDTHRLVTLLGTGGVGKTRLLLELGRRLREAGHAVVLCELAGLTGDADLDAVADTVAAALAIEGRPGERLAERLTTVLRDAEVVLLLDNCEQVLDPVAALVEQLLAGCPGIAVVTTTRERLRVAGEQLCPVPPLPLSPDSPAERLFVERAGAVVPGFAPDDAERDTIVEIVRRLDGLPLAIELAAARLHTMSVAEVRTGLDRRFRLLSAGARTSTRHGSLAAAVEWSVAALDDARRATFAAVSVFSGPFDLDAAATVCDRPAVDVADDLAQLAERSLVQRSDGGRYVLLESLRAYGEELLAGSGTLDTVRARHAHRMADWIEAAHLGIADTGSERVLFEIDDALPELRAALATLLDGPAPGAGDVATAGRIVVALQHYGFLRLRPDVLAWVERVLAADPDDRSPYAASLWSTASYAAWMAGDVAENGARARRAAAVGTMDNPHVCMALGANALFEGRLDESAAFYAQARDAAAGGVDPGTYFSALATGVFTLGYAGRGDIGALADAVAADAERGHGPWASYVWYCAGEAVLDVDPDVARGRFTRALELAEATGASFVTGVAGASKASLEARHGDPVVAAAEYEELLVHWRRAGMWSTQWTMLRSIAVLLDRLGRHRESAVLLGAIRATPSGHRIFGADEVALAELEGRLRRALGDSAYEDAARDGAVLDDAAAVEHSLQSL